MIDLPVTQYAKSGDVYVAYQVFGSGPIDLVFVPGWISHLDLWWDNPLTSDWLKGLSRFARLIMFDKRGTGLSDRSGGPPGMDQRMEDIRVVMDAAGSKRAAVLGISEGGSLAALFAATHPDRCQALIMHGAFAKFTTWFPTQSDLDAFFTLSGRNGARATTWRNSHHPAERTRLTANGGQGGNAQRQARPRPLR
jgi:pimeloyl-ACP methyl ester carboxylesterase